MNASLLYDSHGTEVLLFAALIGEASITPGHLYVAMTHQQLQTFQTHTGIEQFACERMTKAMDCVAFVLEPCFPQIFCKDFPGRTITYGTPIQSVKEIFSALISLLQPQT